MPATANGYPAPAYRDGSRAGPEPGQSGFQRERSSNRARANARTRVTPWVAPKMDAKRLMKALAGLRDPRKVLADILVDILIDAIDAMLDMYRRNVTMAG